MSTKLKTLIVVTIVLSTVFFAATALANTIYLPLVGQEPTPTITPSPTPTETPEPSKGVYIIDIEYDPPDDPLDEYVQIENTKSKAVDMTDWRIKAETGEPAWFFPEFELGSGKKVKVWTGSGSDTSTNLYMGRSEPLWKDNSSCAYLKDEDQVLIDSYCYPRDE